MDTALLHVLRCPHSSRPLRVEHSAAGTVDGGESWLISDDALQRYPIRNGVPRFVPESNYADNFGMQWNRFSKTQLDSYSGHPISAKRFWGATQWRPEDLEGKLVLDVGCGAGRFAEVALLAGARVVALDYSTAVDAGPSELGSPSEFVGSAGRHLRAAVRSRDVRLRLLPRRSATYAGRRARFRVSTANGETRREAVRRFLREVVEKRAFTQVLATAFHEAHEQTPFVRSASSMGAAIAAAELGRR